MEFLDEDARPRFLFQSKPQSSSSSERSKPFLFISLSISSIILSLSLFSIESEPFKSLLFWFSFSLFLGPFAPPSLTGGDIRVGVGPIITDPIEQDPQPETESKKKSSQKRSKPDKIDEPIGNHGDLAGNGNGFSESKVKSKESKKKEDLGSNFDGEGKEWSETEIEILKKQMVKNPVGKPGRWEAIASAFKGKYKTDSVIKKAKELGEKKIDDSDSYAQFLKNRKPVDTRINDENEAVIQANWNSGEDIALLNALKTFPKDVTMRWEKISAAVPGKSKAACMKRVAELKKDFRSSKASNGGN
ncbi:hypothetical protein ERO13_D03G169500v2 [Gossypium hirsutum]|uniref:Transcription factor MAMYB n=1 Tax=Gossypium hirsutum TaxID=3635 RepID=A0A1U8M3X0_GOSHI|nr:transcription factor MAMYB [Gossypium hirsutum]KAG4156359.1 hypothetical protein ERO13_D03G169500v2 [Gossypium hirsutum]